MKREIDNQSTKGQFVSFLRQLMRQLEGMDNAEFERFFAGQFNIELRAPRSRRLPKAACSDELVEKLKSTLDKAGTREEARKLIDRSLRTKSDLMRLAHMLDIPAPKRATSEELRDRLVEATVGYRIRSAVVRGEGGAVASSANDVAVG